MTKQAASKRNLFTELMEGVGAMKEHREAKLTLRTHKVPAAEIKESPGAEFFVAAREKFNVSRSVWANMLRVSPRTVEKWEQGGQVSPLAATFVELVAQYPDTLERLQTLPRHVSRPLHKQRLAGRDQARAPQATATPQRSGKPISKDGLQPRRSKKAN